MPDESQSDRPHPDQPVPGLMPDSASASDDGETGSAIRGEIRLASLRRVCHGLGLVKVSGLSADQEWLRELKAYLLVLPASAVFTHLTAARLLGWELPKLPDQVPVFVAVDLTDPRPRRAGLICSRLVRPGEPGRARGLPVDRPEEILLRMARDLSLLDLLIVLESALHRNHVDRKRMEALLDSRRPGVRMLREAWRRATGGSESAGETVLQQFHHVMEVPVTPQVELHSTTGEFIGRADLLVDGTDFVHEYDGAHHRSTSQQRTDLRRARGLADSPYIRKGFTLDDLLNHPATTMHEIDQALGRPHDLGRLRRWRGMVENSLYDEAGRQRVLNRWRRRTPIIDWTGSAS